MHDLRGAIKPGPGGAHSRPPALGSYTGPEHDRRPIHTHDHKKRWLNFVMAVAIC